ncbi:MAG: glycoside hydrolase family 16 protein [Clostridia bacterium]|nr:glycoside hydrolase family 16 protein [Clostridia bacterium]
MKKVILLLALILIFTGCSNAVETPVSTEPAPTETEVAPTEEPTEDCSGKGFEYDEDNLTYNLVWADEFDYEGLPDDSKWSYDVGGRGWGNNELQYYTEGENANVSDGYLTITARKEEYRGNDYTSSRMVTKLKGDWLYGKIEVSAKLPSGRGTWPAIWMLPTRSVYGGWPRSGEIDIMEHVGFAQGEIHGTVHTDAYNHKDGTQIGKSITRDDVSEVFHKYSIEWFPDKIVFMIDDKLYFIFKPSNLINCPSDEEWPFDQKFHLILNIAIGGDWGGAQGIDDSIFPQEMVIDYVRVYQAEEFAKYSNED